MKNNKMKINLKMILLFLSFTGYSFSQTNSIKEVGEYLTNSKNSVATNATDNFQNLLTNLNPSVYINKKIVTLKSDQPICLFTDVQSLNYLNTLSFPYKTIEFVSIRVKSMSELNSKIDLGVFNNYGNLKYILLIFEFNIKPSDLIKTVIASDKQNVFYKIELQS